MSMKFEWDEAKNRQNIKKHGFDFADTTGLFANEMPFLVSLDTKEDYGEERWKGIGMLKDVLVVVVIFTEPGKDRIRIISLRKASSQEKKAYEKEIKNRLGAG